MQLGNSMQRWVDAAGQLNSMLCGPNRGSGSSRFEDCLERVGKTSTSPTGASERTDSSSDHHQYRSDYRRIPIFPLWSSHDGVALCRFVQHSDSSAHNHEPTVFYGGIPAPSVGSYIHRSEGMMQRIQYYLICLAMLAAGIFLLIHNKKRPLYPEDQWESPRRFIFFIDSHRSIRNRFGSEFLMRYNRVLGVLFIVGSLLLLTVSFFVRFQLE